jgi:hypothetical protein
MPLRDHFRSPVNDRHSWDSFHGGWPMMIVQQFFPILPPGYTAAPSVHFGKNVEVDIATFEETESETSRSDLNHNNTATATIVEPTLTVETELSNQDEFEVRVYDTQRERRLVAAIEIVSPANKDRPENRRAFVAKVSALLQRDVCVSIVDLVTIREFNLYADLLEFIGSCDPQLGETPPHLYCVTIRTRKPPARHAVLEMWYYPLALGQALPTIPIWLNEELRVQLPLETGYEETCRLLHIA